MGFHALCTPFFFLQVLADFLRLMHQRKEEEVQHVSSQIGDLAQDIQQVSVYVCLFEHGCFGHVFLRRQM